MNSPALSSVICAEWRTIDTRPYEDDPVDVSHAARVPYADGLSLHFNVTKLKCAPDVVRCCVANVWIDLPRYGRNDTDSVFLGSSWTPTLTDSLDSAVPRAIERLKSRIRANQPDAPYYEKALEVLENVYA